MKSKTFLYFITGCILFFTSYVYSASNSLSDEAMMFAETKGREIIQIFQEQDLEERYRKLDELIVEYIDIDYIAKFVIGKYWRQMTDKQREDYRIMFERYGLAFYKTLPLEYAKNFEYDVVGATEEGKFANVSVNLKVKMGNDWQNISLIFRLHKPLGKMKVVDVKVAESSLLLSYRSKFYEMIARNDDEIEWFLEDFADLTLSMEYNLKQNLSNQQKSLEFSTEKK